MGISKSFQALALETGRSLLFECIRYFESLELAPDALRLETRERYGREAGRRVVFDGIPHTGYWFEYR